jgi:hypothetical protein
MPARIASRCNTAITPAATGIVPSARTRMPRPGWSSSRRCCCLCLTFLLTFTLPAGLREFARRQPRLIYDLLFRMSAEATQKLAQDPRFVGGQVGMVGVLHTWGRNLAYHPHVHYLVPAGGLAADGKTWLAARQKFLLPVKALSRIFRAKMRQALAKLDVDGLIPPDVWRQNWVVHCKAVGCGQLALKYLAPYIFRVAISNRRILKLEDERSDLPLSGDGYRSGTAVHPGGRRIHPPFSAAHPAQGLRQGPLLWLLQFGFAPAPGCDPPAAWSRNLPRWMRFNPIRPKRQPQSRKGHTFVPFVVVRCNLETRSCRPKAGRRHEPGVGIGTSPFQSAVSEFRRSGLRFLETKWIAQGSRFRSAAYCG